MVIPNTKTFRKRFLYWCCQECIKGWKIAVQKYGNERKDVKRWDEFLTMLESIDVSVTNFSRPEFQAT